MPSKKKHKDTSAKAIISDLDLPLSLYFSFAEITGIPIKICDADGQTMLDAGTTAMTGPCALLNEEDAFCEVCADSHAAAAAMAMELRRPYIYNCHTRLASWAVPVLQSGKPLPVVIICGGVLLSKPDMALIKHLKSIAGKHGIDPDELIRSMESVPVFARKYLRAIADFLFQMSSVLASYVALPGASKIIAPPPTPDLAPAPVVFPPARMKETRKTRVERARVLERQNVETEIARLLWDRKPEAAQAALMGLLEDSGEAGSGIASNLETAETFTRLFRILSKGARISQALLQKQSRLIHSLMSGQTPAEEACRQFILTAEEITGEPRPRKIRAIQKYIERNLSKKLTLGTVGTKFGLKEKPLDALVRKHCGMGFTDYVVSLRISQAKRLLRTTDLSMGEIAAQTGFSDQSHFTRVFKSKLGTTPTAFREKEE